MTGILVGAVLVLLALSVLACLRSMSTASSPLGRVVALDVALSTVLVGIAGAAALDGTGTYADLLLVASLVGVASTSAMARFVESRRSDDE